MTNLLNRLWVRGIVAAVRREDGQTFAEYAVVVSLIAVGVVGAVGTLRTAVITALTTAASSI